jgi:hypothetical protein
MTGQPGPAKASDPPATKTPEASVMMRIPGVGPFLRVLLVVRLMEGYAVT